MKQTVSNGESSASLANVSTLSIDIGGTGLKTSVLDRTGKMLVERVSMATPYPCSPTILLKALADLVAPLATFRSHLSGISGRDPRRANSHGAAFRKPCMAQFSICRRLIQTSRPSVSSGFNTHKGSRIEHSRGLCSGSLSLGLERFRDKRGLF